VPLNFVKNKPPTITMKSISRVIVAATTVALACDTTHGFMSSTTSPVCKTTELHAENISRRSFAAAIISTIGIASSAALPEPASASYSAFAAREKDWEDRKKVKGGVSYSSSVDLRAQLREIAPMNSEASMLFCPNGASAAVSPLMENRCGERMAAPSVFGRGDDSTGNSVPGFKAGSGYAIGAGSVSASNRISSDPTVGGFPKYN